jgi:hypothetical protein
MRYPTLEEQTVLLMMLAKNGPVDITSPEFRFRYFTILVFVHTDNPKDAIIQEIEEAYMEIQSQHPQTPEDFLFWAWTDTSFDFEETEAWNLRYQMMKHHFEQRK